MVTAVGTINSMVKASSTIGHPLMKRFFERFSALGLDEALREARQQDHSGAFEEIWLTYREERRSGEQAMWSIEDATALVLQSRSHALPSFPEIHTGFSRFQFPSHSSRIQVIHPVETNADHGSVVAFSGLPLRQTHSGRGFPSSSLQSLRLEDSTFFLSSSALF